MRQLEITLLAVIGGALLSASLATTVWAQQAQRRHVEWPTVLSGTVVLSSGDVPSEKIRLYCVCGSRTVSEGRTDSKGRFSLRVGRNSSLSSMDASIGGTSHGPVPVDFMSDSSDAFRRVDLSGCTLETNAPGFRSKALCWESTTVGGARTLVRSS